ncbi:MAG: crossover junction endodeoxyribonuclease RuvC [Parcubacteria group bacterium Licking1014_1]|nr:MAG: crossover junction endodeoxyribonuclease RuvC [Parcubacteria group bacterium Licking1014_1]
MIIIGIDPGLATVGFGIIKKNKELNVLDFGCIITEKTFPTGERLKKIHQEIIKLIEKNKPDIISVESLYFFKNLKTVMPVSQAKGVILLAAAQKNIPVCEFTPLQVKMTITGYGRAEKKQIYEMVNKIVNLKSFDFKKNNRKKDDAIDALGVAICAAFKVVEK